MNINSTKRDSRDSVEESLQKIRERIDIEDKKKEQLLKEIEQMEFTDLNESVDKF